MDTGGGIIKARWFLDTDAPFLVHNIDIYSDIDLDKLYRAHLASNSLATLAVSDRKTSRNLLLDQDGFLSGWKNNATGETIIVREEKNLRPVAFSGIHIIEPEIFNLIDSTDPFSMTTAYLELARDHQINTYDHTGDTWIDMAHRDNFPGVSWL